MSYKQQYNSASDCSGSGYNTEPSFGSSIYGQTETSSQSSDPGEVFHFDSEEHYKKVMAVNTLSPFSILKWKTLLNAYWLAKYGITIGGAYVVYCVAAMVVRLLFGISLPFAVDVINLIISLIFFFLFGGGFVICVVLLIIYMQWYKDREGYYRSNLNICEATYCNHKMVTHAFGVTKNNYEKTGFARSVAVNYVTENGVPGVAYSNKNNMKIFDQYRLNEPVYICKVHGWFKKELEVALLPRFVREDVTGATVLQRNKDIAEQKNKMSGGVENEYPW